MLFRFQTKLFANMFELRIFFCSKGCTVMKINITSCNTYNCCLGTEADDTRTRNWLVKMLQSSKQSSKSGYNDLGGTFTQALYDLLCQGRLNLFDEFRAPFNKLIESEMEEIKQNPTHLICIIPSQSLDFPLSERQRFAIALSHAKRNYDSGE